MAMRTTAALALVLRMSVGVSAGAILVGVGCAQELPKVSEAKTGADYNRGALLLAIKGFTDSERTSEAYLILANAIAELQSGFDEEVALEAERNLVFLALPPLEAVLERPADGQMFELAGTVWPTVLGEAPREGESPRQFVDRLCRDFLSAGCRRIVETHRPAFVLAEVWLRFRDRAREAVSDCMTCDELSGYPHALDRFEVVSTQLSVARTSLEEAGRPTRWPNARAHGSPWQEGVLFSVDDEGRASLAGSSLQPDEWRPALAAARGGAAELGVFVGPAERLSTIRALAREAERAGFARLVLQSREVDYPFTLRGYALRLGRGGKSVRVREVDTAQVLVHLIDDFASRDEIPRIEWISSK